MQYSNLIIGVGKVIAVIFYGIQLEDFMKNP